MVDITAIRDIPQARRVVESALYRHTLEWLRDYETRHGRQEYFGFWNGELWASNFYPSTFQVEWGGSQVLNFDCNEQWFMFRKAWKFGDAGAMELLLQPGLQPSDYRDIGRSVRHFDAQAWAQVSDYYMLEGLVFKFTQNPELAQVLMGSGDRVLVECSPVDRIWGIGIARECDGGADDSVWRDSRNWRGDNCMGFRLMDLRDALLNR